MTDCMKKLIVITLVLAMVFSMTACSSQKAAPVESDETDTPEEEIKMGVDYVSFGGGVTGGSYNVLSSGMCQIFSEKVSGVTVNAETTSGSTENMKSLIANSIDMGFATADSAYCAREGIREFEELGGADIKMVLAGFANWYHVIVRADSGIKSIADLKGKTIGCNSGVQVIHYVPETMKVFGVKEGEYTITPLTTSELADAMRDKQIDCIMQYGGIPTSAYTDLATTTDIIVLPIDGEYADAMLKVFPYFSKGVLPAGSYRGITEDVPGICVRTGVFANASFDEEFVYQFTKCILEKNDELAQIYAPGSEFTVEQLIKFNETGLIPLHDGVIRYLKEVGKM